MSFYLVALFIAHVASSFDFWFYISQSGKLDDFKDRLVDIWKDRGLLERQTTLGKTNDILERHYDKVKED